MLVVPMKTLSLHCYHLQLRQKQISQQTGTPHSSCFITGNCIYFYFVLLEIRSRWISLGKARANTQRSWEKTTYTGSCCVVIPDLDLGYTKVTWAGGIADNKVKLDGWVERAHPKAAFLGELKTQTSRLSLMLLLLEQGVLINSPPPSRTGGHEKSKRSIKSATKRARPQPHFPGVNPTLPPARQLPTTWQWAKGQLPAVSGDICTLRAQAKQAQFIFIKLISFAGTKGDHWAQWTSYNHFTISLLLVHPLGRGILENFTLLLASILIRLCR